MTQKEIRDGVALLLAAAALVGLYAWWVDARQLYILGLYDSMNDQAGHVDAARRMLNFGRPENGIIYTSVMGQDYRWNYFYMPGHALCTAGSIALLGDSPLAHMAPNLLAYFLCLAAMYAIGRRLAGHRAGLLAGFLFAVFPAHIVYAVTAMTEMTFLAAGLLAFVLFLFSPRAWRPWTGALALSLPIIFRETGLLWILPMAAVIIGDPGDRQRFRRAVILLFLGAGVALAVMQWDWVQGRPSRFLLNIVGGTFQEVYADAVNLEARRPGHVREWVGLFAAKGRGNMLELGQALATPSLNAYGLYFIFGSFLSLIPMAIGADARFRLLAGATWSAAMMLAFFLTFIYVWHSLVAVRLLMMVALWAYILMACRLARYRTAAWALSVLVVVLPLLFLTARSIKRSDVERRTMSAFLNTIAPDPSGVLICPWRWGPVYIHEHFPAQWAFIPANKETFALLNQRFAVATAILSPRDVRVLGTAVLHAHHLSADGEAVGPDGKTYLIFRRQQRSDQTNKDARP